MNTPQNPPELEKVVRPTTLLEPERLAARLGVDLLIATETFQHTGSFKFRAAYNVAANVPHHQILAASSGNFGQALAYACRLVGKECTVVMPSTSAQVKVAAVREYGGNVDLIDVREKSRGARVAELAAKYPEAYVASAYDDPLVIAGNASLGREICRRDSGFEMLVAPVGGGGLISGLITGIRESRREVQVIGAEPLIGNDVARSLRAGRIIANESEPQTIADGARTLSVGEHNWPILVSGLAGIVEVPEDAIREAVLLLFSLANLKVEPTGALGVGAILTSPERFTGRRVCCVISGGNVDPAVYRELLAYS